MVRGPGSPLKSIVPFMTPPRYQIRKLRRRRLYYRGQAEILDRGLNRDAVLLAQQSRHVEIGARIVFHKRAVFYAQQRGRIVYVAFE